MNIDEIRARANEWPCRHIEHLSGEPCTRLDRARLLAAVEGVLELHKPDAETGKCEECTYARFSTSSVSWPCPTTRAIRSALEAS